MKSYFSINLENLLEKNNLSQRALAESLNISNTAISRYIKDENEPSASLLLSLKEKFNINIDDFLTRKIDYFDVQTKTATILFNSNYNQKFIGNYLIYYYNNGFYKGKVDALAYNTLKYGVLSVYSNSKNKVVVSMLLFKSRTDAENYKLKLDKMTNSEIEEEFKNDEAYQGEIDFNFTQIYINISNEKQNDKGLIILNNPPTDKNYIGGLGTINSVSHAREPMPCVQFIIISKFILNKTEAELYELLSLDSSEINVKNETEQLINLFKNLYTNTEGNKDMFLEEYQKVKIIENCLENLFKDLIDANVFRYAKVSNSEDDDFYRLIKDELKK